MAYVIQQPHSNTNPSDKYRVVDYERWNAYRQEDSNYLPVEGEFTSYAEAQTFADTKNTENPE